MTPAGVAPTSAVIEAPPTLLVSVIVPVRNDRQAYLQTFLAALEQQTLPRSSFEVIIGDDGSTDGSADVATEDGWIRVVKGPPRNAYAARNQAAAVARAEVLVFCDSDCRPEPGWLEAGLAALENADVVAGRIRFILPERRTIWTLIDMDCTKDHERQVQMDNAETANLFVRREVFERIDGFDDAVPTHGDFDFALRAVASGARLVYAPDAQVWHPTRDKAGPVLNMVWIMHRWYAAREVRDRRRPLGLKLRWWVPFIHVRWRLRSGRSIGLDRHWMAQNGVRPRFRENVLAVPLLYVVLPWVAGIAQMFGWFDGRRLRASV
jgi:GT2 family glycosyltransferase